MTRKNIYIINYKETTIDSNGVMNVECGTCEVGYLNEKDAIEYMYKITDDVMNKHLEELDNGNCYRDSNDNGDWQMVTMNDDTYEYWVVCVDVEM